MPRTPPLDREALERELGIEFAARNLLVTFHPVTLDTAPSSAQFQALLDAFDGLDGEIGLFFTKPNADPEGRALIEMLDDVSARPHAHAFTSLGHRRYVSLMAVVDAVVGNSSSGLLEAPSLGKPTVNIGSRQRGRLRAASVIDCPSESVAIAAAVREAFGRDCRGVENPYGDGHATERILEVLRALGDPRALLAKRFVDLPVP